MKRIALFALALLMVLPARADEGMWLLPLLEKMNGKALKDAGLNPIFQLTCRDRNRIAIQADLLTSAMFGIDNVLAQIYKYAK